MWIFLNNAFLSAVAHRHDPDALLVRGRIEGDIQRVFPDAVVTMTPSADYRFRATIPRKTVAAVLAEQVSSIDYDNFKNSIEEPDRHDACMNVWSVMHRLQTDRARS